MLIKGQRFADPVRHRWKNNYCPKLLHDEDAFLT